MFDLQIKSQCGSTYNCLSRTVPEIHLHHAGTNWQNNTSVFLFLSFNSRWHRSAPPRLSAVSPRLPSKQCQYLSGWTQIVFELGGWNVGRFLFLHSSFLQAINAVMLCPAHVQKVPQTSQHLCPAKLQTTCDICCACQSTCLFIPTDSGVPRTVDPQKSL